MFIENAIEGILKAAAWNGEIPVRPENITVDAEATSEWEGENRVFIYRESSRPLGDITGANDYSGWMESIISIVILGRNKADSEWVKTKVFAVIDRIRNLAPGNGEEITNPETLVFGGGDTFRVEQGDVLTVDRVRGDGTFENLGTTKGKLKTSDYLLWSPFYDEIKKISSSIVKEVFAVERVEDGTFKAQYYNTIKMGFLHKQSI